MNYTKEEVLRDLGIESLEEQLQEQTLGAFLNTLDMRTGDAVAALLTDEQLKELDDTVQKDGDAAGEEWLKAHITNLDTIEEAEYRKLVAEIHQNAGEK